MLPHLIQYTHTRSTREAHTNFPNALSQLYSSSTPRHQTKQSLPPILSSSINKTSTKFKKMLYEKRIMRDLSANREKKEKILKGKVAERFWNEFNIFINPRWLNDSLEEIFERGLYMFRIREMNKAAEVIQKNWRFFRFWKGKQEIRKKREKAAKRIQKAWKSFVAKCIVPKIQARQREEAARLIQRCYRGYLARMKYSVMVGRKKLKENLKYFESVWDEIVVESVLLIQKAWRKYRARVVKNKPSKKQVGNRFASTVKAARKNFRKK